MAYKDSLKPWAVARQGKNFNGSLLRFGKAQGQGTPITNKSKLVFDLPDHRK